MDNDKALETKIQERYSQESENSCNLSCGSNLDFLAIKQSEYILDLGCGRGNETIQAAILAGSEGMAIGLDITSAMINKALTNAADKEIKNIDFVVGDIENLNLKDNFFDAVLSNCVINHAKDKKKVYCEIYRVLKYGGRFVISDAVTKYPLPPEVKNDPEAWAQCFGGSITEEEYLENIKQSGFENIEILKRREYLKNGYDFISVTIRAYKNKV